MLKFIVVAVRREGLSHRAFRDYFERVHGPLAEKIPGLIGYRRCFPLPDPRRSPPLWDAVIEMTFADRAAMEAAWASAEGLAASKDNANLMDLERSSWSIVEEEALI
jgi:uncharacterized protein (TIGR02118 family)